MPLNPMYLHCTVYHRALILSNYLDNIVKYRWEQHLWINSHVPIRWENIKYLAHTVCFELLLVFFSCSWCYGMTTVSTIIGLLYKCYIDMICGQNCIRPSTSVSAPVSMCQCILDIIVSIRLLSLFGS